MKQPEIKKVLVIGSGPAVIGRSAEFDYAGTQALRTAGHSHGDLALGGLRIDGALARNHQIGSANSVVKPGHAEHGLDAGHELGAKRKQCGPQAARSTGAGAAE